LSYIAMRNTQALKKAEEASFGGINRRELAFFGEFLDMKNMSSEETPFLKTSRKSVLSDVYNFIFVTENGEEKKVKIQNVRAAAAVREDTVPLGFCGVIGTEFYYNGKAKQMKKPAVYDENGEFLYGMEIAEDGEIQLLWANRIIIIHGYDCKKRNPYIYYYDTDDEGDYNDKVKCFEYDCNSDYSKRTVNVYEDGSALISFTYKTNSAFRGGYWNIKAGDSVFIDELMTYSDSRWKEYKGGDITSAIVTSYSETKKGYDSGYYLWDITLNLEFKNYKGENPIVNEFSKEIVHVYKKIPYMNRLALHKGRLWGANPNGEFVYASALGELFEFNRFEGINDDSVFLESSSQGGYKGVISCGEQIVTLKQNELEAIYGELPKEFAVGKSYPGYGCTDINSCVVIDKVLYFLSSDGFYRWSGTLPEPISKELNKKYISAYSYSDGIYYKTCALCDDGIENLVFDTRNGLWHKGDGAKTEGAFSYNGDCFEVKNSEIFRNTDSYEDVEWFCESIKHFYEEYELKRVSEVLLRVKLEKGSFLRFYSSVDADEWRLCDEFMASTEEEYKNLHIPIRLKEGNYMRYKISGKGGCTLLGLKFIYDSGGYGYDR